MRPPQRILCPLAVVALVTGCADSNVAGERADVFVVQRGPLPIRVTEQAEIQPMTSTRIKSEMEGQSTIIYLIPEGTVVEAGQKLVELDASSLQERKAQQEITLHRSDAARIGARKELEIVNEQFEADKLGGENTVKIAEIDMEKFLGKLQEDGSRDMGEREQQVVEAQANIQLAEQEVQLAKNKLEWSVKLHDKGFITKDDMERDELDYQRRQKNLRVARNELDILLKFTHPKELIRLEQGIRESRTNLDGIVARGQAKLAQAKADLEAKEKEYELALERFQNLEKQIKNAVIRAPTPGLVVYASEDGGHRGRQEFVEEGATVRERQTLIELPDVTRMIASLKVHEASVDKVRVGQPATLKVDAFTDREFSGFVRRISPVADSGSRWSNNGLKVYKTEVELTGENLDLKPGMSASVTIVVAQLADVVYVPLQAIRRQGSVPFVWLDTPAGPVAHQVGLGLNDFQFVEITAGLAAGDRVFLATPPTVVEKEFEQPAQDATAPVDAAVQPAEASAHLAPPGADAPDGHRPEAPAEQEGERPSAMQALEELLERKYPELAVIVKNDRRAWRDNEELKQALEDDDELREARDAMIQEMRARFGDRGRGRQRGAERGSGDGERDARGN